MPSAAITTSPSATTPLANDTRAMSPSCSKAMPRWPVWITFAGSRSDSMVTRSARCIPNVAFQPAESVTWTGAIGVPSWRKYRESFPTLAPTQPDPLQLADAVRGQEHPGADFAKGWGLLVNRNAEPMGHQGIRGEKAADPAPNDDYV